MASPDKKRKIAPKVFNDPIHGNIELHPLLVKIVDTPQFQRLRFIKQLGGVYFVYPGASHNRFEHSIGVCHLAGRFVRALRDKQPDLEITDEDELCVEIAALCHDLGHGPFSHLFDKRFIKDDRINNKQWKHEQGSIDMLDHMLNANAGLAKEFDKKFTETDKTFIKELIKGQNKDDRKGRTKEKWFLYEIVSNKRNEIDVDKWDYFARDCHMLGIGNNFNHDRLISFSRVINVKGEDGKLERQICYRDKEATNLYDMFHIRNLLHQRAYQHKTSNSVEIMLAEALVLADEFIKFEGENRIPVRMSDTVNDMKAFTLLNDGVIHKIIESDREELEKSKEILNWILERKLYRCVGEKRFAGGTFEKGEDVIKDIKHTLTDKRLKEILCKLDWKDFIVVEVVPLNYGNEDKDPIANVNFYTKNEPDSAKPRDKDDVSLLLPNVFEEQSVRVYYKNQTDPKNQPDLENQTDRENQISLQDCKDMFEEWVKSTLKDPRNQVTSGSSQDPRNQGTSGSLQDPENQGTSGSSQNN